MGATETERELDRVWKALDDATGRINALERGRGLQHAPAPDYRVSEPGPVEPPPECPSCDLPMARYAGPRAGEGGWTCLHCESPRTDEEPEPVEACSCEEAVALRAEVERLRDPYRERTWAERFSVLTARAERAEARVAELERAPTAYERQLLTMFRFVNWSAVMQEWRDSDRLPNADLVRLAHVALRRLEGEASR